MDEVSDIQMRECVNIARAVERQVKKNEGENITSSQIREMVNAKLIERGEVDKAREYEKVGIPTADIKKIIRSGNRDNANLSQNPETVHKMVADAAFKQFTVNELPKGIAEAHNSGDIHVHDAEYFMQRSLNCLQHDLRFFIRNGLKVDGTGEHTSVAGPANNIETLVNHAGQVLMASQVNMSGGQSLPLLNIFMAPFVKGLSYERVKQAMQMFIFNLNMSYTSRGGQAVFSSINLEFMVPEFLKSEAAYGPGGKECGVYGDYEEEARIIQRAITDVLYNGDAVGKPHFFPNTCYSLRKEIFEDPSLVQDLYKVHELCVKYSTPYFINQETSYNGLYSNKMGCRTSLGSTWTGDWDKDCLRTGNLAYVTLNLPRLAYKSENDSVFYQKLDKALSIATDVLLIRREEGLKCLNEYKLLSFLTQPDADGTPYYRVENATLSFGFVGLNEMLKAMGYEGGIVNPDGQEKAAQILEYINNYAKTLTNDTGYRWTVIATPAESTAHRFATIDKERYPEAIVNGEKGEYYYTNSSHVPVASEVLLPKRIEIESKFHPLTSGGNIFHAWLGESKSNAESLMSLTKKIMEKTEIGFWAYSGAFSFCFNCETLMSGLKEECFACKSDDVEMYDRITGYTQAIGTRKGAQGGWNDGKKGELKDRYRYEV